MFSSNFSNVPHAKTRVKKVMTPRKSFRVTVAMKCSQVKSPRKGSQKKAEIMGFTEEQKREPTLTFGFSRFPNKLTTIIQKC